MGWIIAVSVLVAVAYLIEVGIRAGRCAPEYPDVAVSPDDMSARPGWAEYTMATRLEREVAPDIDTTDLGAPRG